MPTIIIMGRDAVVDRIRGRDYADNYLVQAFLRRSAARFRRLQSDHVSPPAGVWFNQVVQDSITDLYPLADGGIRFR